MLSLSYSSEASQIYHIECYAGSTKIIDVLTIKHFHKVLILVLEIL